MTAIVTIMNKHAVAIAADSAVTFGNTHKVVNSGNKIFTLSKYEPVAIMTFNNAAFMGVPWEVIIKGYRKQLKESSFETVEGYKNDFIKYIKTDIIPDYIKEPAKLQNIREIFNGLYLTLLNKVRQQQPKNVNAIALLFKNELVNMYKRLSNVDKCSEMRNISLSDFKVYTRSELDYFYTSNVPFAIPNELKDVFEETMYYLLTNQCVDANFSGLVFVGYGTKQFFPSLRSVNISACYGDYIKYYETTSEDIQNDGTYSCVVPFAQKDVIETLLDGINPEFKVIIAKVTYASYLTLRNEIISELQNKDECKDIVEKLKGFDLKKLLNDTSKNLDGLMKMTYTNNLINTIAMLDKEDLADMAESFISLTSRVRRMSPREETVGGPVDVAVISKGDGFVWIKRKHYFQPQYNSQFFNNYNRQ